MLSELVQLRLHELELRDKSASAWRRGIRGSGRVRVRTLHRSLAYLLVELDELLAGKLNKNVLLLPGLSMHCQQTLETRHAYIHTDM